MERRVRTDCSDMTVTETSLSMRWSDRVGGGSGGIIRKRRLGVEVVGLVSVIVGVIVGDAVVVVEELDGDEVGENDDGLGVGVEEGGDEGRK
jgi:hypothetical protein